MIKAILWDIGGVLLTDPLLADFWGDNPKSKNLRTKFGEGKMSIQKFIELGSKLLGLPNNEFEEKYREIYCSVTPLSETVTLVHNLNCPQYILSDTNPIHGEFVQKEYSSVFTYFKKTYLSYEIGMRKNSSKVFTYVSKNIGLPAQEILFIDNKQKLLDFAKEAGFQTYLFKNVNDLRNYLHEQKLL